MAETSYPFDGVATTEAQYSQLFRRLNSTGVWGAPTDTSVKATGDSSGMNVKVSAGYAMVRGHFYNNSAQATLTIAASSSNPRKDLVVLRLDPTANTITLAVVTGTPSATPADPSLTQTDVDVYEMAIARVNVPASASTIAAANVDDLRPFMGTQFRAWTTNNRPASPTVPTVGFNTTLNAPEYWNGSAWVLFMPAITASMITDAANLVSGKIYAGGSTSGVATTVFVQSGTPTANAIGDLWFY